MKDGLDTPEQAFRKLDVQHGDRIRLTELMPFGGHNYEPNDAGTLEGVVRGVKIKDGVSRVQVQGFHHIGIDIWWPVSRFRVEVLHRAYRCTEEDRLIAALAGMYEDRWQAHNEKQREQYREIYAPRLARVRETLRGVDSDAPKS